MDELTVVEFEQVIGMAKATLRVDLDSGVMTPEEIVRELLTFFDQCSTEFEYSTLTENLKEEADIRRAS